MSGDLVHADPNDVRRLARALEQYEQKFNEITKQVQKAIDAANWQDRQKDQFADRFRGFQKQSTRFVGGQVQQFAKSLNALAKDLEQARAHRF